VTIHLQSVPKANPPCWQVQVQDQGIGIAEADLPRLLDRFYRVYPAGNQSKGSGLGLSIVQAIAQRYQGAISIDSTIHFGTTVTVTLPTQLTHKSHKS
jgi:OmpR-family two-component system manganese-sensing sensor histidine kinase